MKKKLTPDELRQKIRELELKRENNLNRYIIPIEIKLEELREKLTQKQNEK